MCEHIDIDAFNNIAHNIIDNDIITNDTIQNISQKIQKQKYLISDFFETSTTSTANKIQAQANILDPILSKTNHLPSSSTTLAPEDFLSSYKLPT